MAIKSCGTGWKRAKYLHISLRLAKQNHPTAAHASQLSQRRHLHAGLTLMPAHANAPYIYIMQRIEMQTASSKNRCSPSSDRVPQKYSRVSLANEVISFIFFIPARPGDGNRYVPGSGGCSRFRIGSVKKWVQPRTCTFGPFVAQPHTHLTSQCHCAAFCWKKRAPALKIDRQGDGFAV
jgi:hypothetical protein